MDSATRNRIEADKYVARLEAREAALQVCRDYIREQAQGYAWEDGTSLLALQSRCDAAKEILKRIGELR